MARIDDRLIHGQVIHGWLPRVHVALIVVADAEAAADLEAQSAMGLAVPEELEVRFVAPAEVADLLAHEERPTLILFRDAVGALEAIRHGLPLRHLNLGNRCAPGGYALTKNYSCSPEELAALRELLALGVELESRAVPTAKATRVEAHDLAAH